MPWEFFRKAAEEELEEMRERIGRFSVAFSQGTAEVSEEATLPPSELDLLKQAELERLYAAREARFKRFDPGI